MSPPKPSLDDLRIDRRGQPRARISVWWLALLLAVAAGSIAVWWLTRPKPVPVRTAAAREAGPGVNGTRTVLNASGYVTARRTATVSSKVTGKVLEVLIEEGVRVQEGQVLARLDDTNIRASLRLAEAQLEAARQALTETKVRIDEAARELQRQAGLLKSEVATQADFERAEAAWLALKARLEQQSAEVTVADRQVASWQQQMEDTVIRAPFAGIVTVKNAQPGEMISPISAGSSFTRTGICTIVDMQSLEIEIDVSESYINRVEPGQAVEATLDAYADWKIPCKVIAIIPTADRQKSTVKVRVGFEKLEPRILPEMSVKVAFHESVRAGNPAPGASPISIPKSALAKEEGRDVVFVVKNGRAERRAVSVSALSGEEAIISAGLSAGEKVALEPGNRLQGSPAVKEQP